MDNGPPLSASDPVAVASKFYGLRLTRIRADDPGASVCFGRFPTSATVKSRLQRQAALSFSVGDGPFAGRLTGASLRGQAEFLSFPPGTTAYASSCILLAFPTHRLISVDPRALALR